MTRALRVVLAVGLPAAVLVVGQAASASVPPTEPPGSELGAPVPADFVSLTDDTGTITVMVPGSWTDVATAPDTGMPFIEASTNRQQYNDTFDVAGMTYRAAPFNADTETAARSYGLTSGCGSESIRPYDDGVFSGARLIYTDCGPDGAAEFHVIAANPQSQAFTALLRIQLTGADEQPILQGILDTFNVASAAGTTGSTLPGSSVVPSSTGAATGAFPPPTGEIPADWMQLVDGTRTIAISVPSAWTATDLVPGQNEDGSPQPWISATTDQDLFFPPAGERDTFSVPGVIFRAYPFNPDTTQRLATSSYHDVCTAGPLETYDDGVFVGHIQTFTACDGTASSIVRASANPADQAFTADLLIQLTGEADDAATLNGLLLSFGEVDPGAGPATTVAGAPTTTVAAGPTTTTAAAGGTVDALEQAIQDQTGVAITPEQSACLDSSAAQLTPADLAAAAADLSAMPASVLVVLLNCGIDVFGLPSG
jgi:hypothetical protein